VFFYFVLLRAVFLHWTDTSIIQTYPGSEQDVTEHRKYIHNRVVKRYVVPSNKKYKGYTVVWVQFGNKTEIVLAFLELNIRERYGQILQ
jgi:hypothetical protein